MQQLKRVHLSSVPASIGDQTGFLGRNTTWWQPLKRTIWLAIRVKGQHLLDELSWLVISKQNLEMWPKLSTLYAPVYMNWFHPVTYWREIKKTTNTMIYIVFFFKSRLICTVHDVIFLRLAARDHAISWWWLLISITTKLLYNRNYYQPIMILFSFCISPTYLSFT